MRLTRDTAQGLDLVRAFLRIKPCFKAVLPEDMARLRERLDEVFPPDGRYDYYDLFYNIYAVLSARHEPLTMGELASTLGVPLSTATRMVDWLVEHKHATRLADREDRRIVRVALTDAGRQLCQAIDEFVAERTEQVLHRLSAEERQDLIRLLWKVIRALEEICGEAKA